MTTRLRYPPFLRLLFFVELWERFSYYGMRALLVLYLTSKLGFADAKAYAIYSLFAAIGYAGPIVGGLLADKLMGFRNMVTIGGSIMVLGHTALALVELNNDLIYFGLALIAIGTGLFKGNITNLLGACYKKDSPERSRGFTLFYVSTNIGSFLASVACGFVAYHYGWHFGFGLAGIGMFIGLVIFVLYQDCLGENGNAPYPNLMEWRFLGVFSPFSIVFILALSFSAVITIMLQDSEVFAKTLQFFGFGIFLVFAGIIVFSEPETRRNLIVLSILIAFKLGFFAVEMQLGSLINLFSERNVDSNILGVNIPAAVSQAINPLSIMILGAIMSETMQFNPKYDILRVGFGILTMAICFYILYVGCINADANSQVSYIYLFVGISFMGLGELLITPYVFSQASALAPKHLKGFIMGVVMLSMAFANLFGIVLAKLVEVPSVDGNVIASQSLSIYQNGFFEIARVNMVLFIVFMLISPLLYRAINYKKKEANLASAQLAKTTN